MRGATTNIVGRTNVDTFLLTRPMRGATHDYLDEFQDIQISTHTPHAGRDANPKPELVKTKISTHTPHAGRDWTQ